jgi:hypothetical protein
MLSAINVLHEALGELFVAIQENGFKCWTHLCRLNYIIARTNAPLMNVKGNMVKSQESNGSWSGEMQLKILRNLKMAKRKN